MSNLDLCRRYGKFSISRELIDCFPEEVLAIMQDVLVVRAEMHFASDCVEYIGMCMHFDKTEPGEEIPKYICTAHDAGWGWNRV